VAESQKKWVQNLTRDPISAADAAEKVRLKPLPAVGDSAVEEIQNGEVP